MDRAHVGGLREARVIPEEDVKVVVAEHPCVRGEQVVELVAARDGLVAAILAVVLRPLQVEEVLRHREVFG